MQVSTQDKVTSVDEYNPKTNVSNTVSPAEHQSSLRLSVKYLAISEHFLCREKSSSGNSGTYTCNTCETKKILVIQNS